MNSFHKIFSIVLACLSLAAVSGCAQKESDFCRAYTDYWADDYSGPLGIQKGELNGEPVMMLAGRPMYLAGLNCYDLFVGADNRDFSHIYATLELLKEQKCPIIRFNCGVYGPNEMDVYFNDREGYLAKVDTIGAVADRCHILLVPSFFWQIKSLPQRFGEIYGAWGDPESQTYKAMQQYTADIVNTLKSHKSAAIWECGNEFNLDCNAHPESPVTPSDINACYKEYARICTECDPDHRMITGGNSLMRNVQWHLAHETEPIGDFQTYIDNHAKHDSYAQYLEISSLFNPDNMDAVSEHCYYNTDTPDHIYNPWRAFSDREIPLVLAEAVACCKQAAVDIGKVYFVGEFHCASVVSEEKMIENYEAFLANKVQLTLAWNFSRTGIIECSFSADTPEGVATFNAMREYNRKMSEW